MSDGQRRLGALLLEMGAVDEARLSAALTEQRLSGRRLGRTLVDSGAIDEDALVDALCRQLKLARWDPERSSEAVARGLVPRELAFRARALPLERLEEEGRVTVVVATSDPLAPAAAKVVRALSERNASVRWVLGGEGELERALSETYGTPSPSVAPVGVAVIRGRPEPMARSEPMAKAESPAIPAQRASANVTGNTLLADDAVLEIVDLDLGASAMTKEPPSLLAEAGESKKEPVALARLAVRRAQVGIREVVSPSAKQSDERDRGGVKAARAPSAAVTEDVVDAFHAETTLALDGDDVAPPVAPMASSCDSVLSSDLTETLDEPPTSPEIPKPTDEQRDKASELHARLIRFAAGESLVDAHREEVMRAVVRVLLDKGLVDEAGLLASLRD